MLSFEVGLRLLWIATGHDHGRLLLWRRACGATGSSSDFWISPDLADARAVQHWLSLAPGSWGTLLSAHPDGPLALPEVLAEPGDFLPRLEQDIRRGAHPPVRLLAEAAGRHRVGEGDRDVRWWIADEFDPRGPAGEHDRGLPGALCGAIELERVRGAQIGRGGVQVNTFVVEQPELRIDFRSVLERPGVAAAIIKLQADPASDWRRALLVEELGGAGWTCRSAGLRLEVDRQPAGLLDYVVMLLGGVLGLQVGDHNSQDNMFAYAITASPTASALLRGNPQLAFALTRVICPPSDGDADPRTLSRLLQRALAGLSIDGAGGLRLGGHHPLPGPGDRLYVANYDGVSIGDGAQDNRYRIDIDEISARLPGLTRPPYPGSAPPGTVPRPPAPPSPPGRPRSFGAPGLGRF